jgi:hypothetical protein
MEKIARVAEEVSNLVRQIAINSEVFVRLDTVTTTMTYSPSGMSDAHCFSLDDYGRFLGEVYIIPLSPYSSYAPSPFSWIYLNPTLISNNSVYEGFDSTINPPIKAVEDGAIPLSLIIGSFLISNKSESGETEHGIMDLNTSIDPLVWYKYCPDYADRVNRMKRR